MNLIDKKLYLTIIIVEIVIFTAKCAYGIEQSKLLSTGIDINNIVMENCLDCSLVRIDRIPNTVYRKYENGNNDELYIETNVKNTIQEAIDQYSFVINESSIGLPNCKYDSIIGDQCVEIPFGIFIRRNNVLVSLTTNKLESNISTKELISKMDMEIILSLEKVDSFASEAGIMENGTTKYVFSKEVSEDEAIVIEEDELIGGTELLTSETMTVEPSIGVMYSESYQGKNRFIFIPAPDGKTKDGDIFDFSVLFPTKKDLFVKVRLIIKIIK